jgi:hypothetical protein
VRDEKKLIAAGVILGRHQNQPRTRFRRPHLRRRAARLQNADYRRISREYANPDGEDYREAENQRHEERNHDQSTLLNCSNQMPRAQLSSMRFLQSTCVDACR